ncbi:MAG TPA: glycosyl hydrolase family 28-related protein, partial [Polyangiales bacterium]|nr:glycosyl hydrolase family 28-related protein [Polyangiales bacterium]
MLEEVARSCRLARALVLAVAVSGALPARAQVLAGDSPDPADADLVLWLKADALALADGAAVARWPDSSARRQDMLGGRHGAGLPQLARDALNGLPAVRFAGVRQTLELAAPIALAQEHTIVVVAQARSSSAGHSDTFVSFCAAAPPRAPRNGDASFGVYERRLRVSYRGALDTRDAQPSAPSEAAIFALVRSDDRTTRAYVAQASTPALSVTTPPSPAVATPKYLRLGASDEPASFLDGDLFEVLVYDRALSPLELRDVYAYLQRKWLPSTARAASIVRAAEGLAALGGGRALDAWYRDRGRSGFDVLDGALELFVRSDRPARAWSDGSFVPLAIEAAPQGLGLTLRSTGSGSLQAELRVTDGQMLVARASGLTLGAGELYHLALSVATDAGSGALTLKLYAAPGNTDIDTAASNFQLASAAGAALHDTERAFGAVLPGSGAKLGHVRVWEGIPREFAALATYPDVARAFVPDPEPAYPAELDPFDPPVTSAPPPAAAPSVAEWTRSAGPGDSLALTGHALSAFADRDEGKDASFLVFGQDAERRGLERAELHRLRSDRAAIGLPAALPRSLYLVWPRNRAGYGRPFALNQTEAWWVGPDRATAGARVALYGRNLSYAGGTSRAWIYLKPLGRAAGQFLSPLGVNPYRVEFELPRELAAGSYEIWAHNGHGRRYGWSRPVRLEVGAGIEWTGATFEPSAFGARPDDDASDSAAIQRALDAAAREAAASGLRTTVRLPAGNFVLTEMLQLPGNVRLVGAGKDRTVLRARGTYRIAAHLIWMGMQRLPNEVAGMTLDADHVQSGNGENAFVLAGNATDTRFYDLRLIALHAPMHVTYLTSTRTSFSDCEFIGKQVLVQHAQQVSFTNCKFRGARHGAILYAGGGTEQFSVTHCTAEDYDTSDDGQSQGRFVNIVNGTRLSRDIYIAHNVTRDLAVHRTYANQNTGEQISWDEARGQFVATPRAAANDLGADLGTLSFRQQPPALDERHTLLAVVIDGKGAGQVRDVTKVEAGRVTVTPAWNVVPDRSSRIALGSYHTRAVVYRNHLDGKAAQARQDEHTASAGIEPYGGASQLVADGNTITDCRHGLYTMGSTNDDPADVPHMLPSLFQLWVNNSIQNAYVGIQLDASGSTPTGIGSFGYVFRGNSIDTTRASATQVVLNTAGLDLDMLVLESTVVTNSPGGFGVAYARVPQRPPSSALLLLHNYFDRGKAPLAGSFGISGPAARDLHGIWLRANKRENFADATRGPIAQPTPELPLRVFEIAASARGKPVSF